MMANAKHELALIFLAVAAAGGAGTFVYHENNAAIDAVSNEGYDVSYAHTGILWADRHGCDLSASGTRFDAKDADGNS